VIDIEALAAPAFLVEFRDDGVPAGLHLNAATRAHPPLERSLAATLKASGERNGALAAALRACSAERSTVETALATAEPDGTACWWASLTPVLGRAGTVTTVLGLCRQVPMPERNLAWTSDHLSLTLRAIHGAEWRYDVERNAYRGSDEIATLLGEAVPRPVAWTEWLDRVHPQDLGLFLAAPARDGVVRFRFYATDGSLRWARCSRVAVTGRAGEVEAVLGVMVDITQEHDRETVLAELAIRDPLTGLLNRRGLLDKVGRLQFELPQSAYLALFAIDLDRFKVTNDMHGHAAGDAVLIEATRRLTATVDGAICARIGGDEFVAVLPVSGEADALRVRDRLRHAFRDPFAFRGTSLPVSASVGVACGSAGVNIIRLIDAADADLYARKRVVARAAAAAA
jgi:diguanylate cyclase (GGDEF)-like protein